MLLATLSLAFTTAACAGDPESTGSGPTPVLDGVYEGKPSSNYAWAGFGGDRYALWKAGAACNDDVASAPPDCAETGSFSIDHAAQTITFTDDATGKSETFEARLGFGGSGSLTTKSVPSGSGELVDRGNQLAQPSSDRIVVADMSVVKRSLHVIFVACSLLTGNGEPLPDPPPPIPITQPVATGSGKGCKK